MTVVFYDGWPYRYAHVVVAGLSVGHSAGGVVCLWAEDDPAQLAGVTLAGLWARLDAWAAAAGSGFGAADRALDAWLPFAHETGRAGRTAEVDLPALFRHASNGHRASAPGIVRGRCLLLPADPTEPADGQVLRGRAFYRGTVPAPPRDLAEFRSLLTNAQLRDLDRSLQQRAPVAANEPSGGLDHVVLGWPRHEGTDAVVLSFSGAGPTLRAHSHPLSPSDRAARLRRAGPDAPVLADADVLIAGVGSVGGQVAVTLAGSGLRRLALHDDDLLHTVNLVRHAASPHAVGFTKTAAIAVRIADTAPWCDTTTGGDLPYDPDALAALVRGRGLVLDCTGTVPMTAALARVCADLGVPLLTGALHHQGALLRVRRQAPGDVALPLRHADPRYLRLPPEDAPDTAGFLELGCTAPVNNAPPAAVLHAAAAVAAAAIDQLTGRRDLPDETVTVLRALPTPPFDQLGPVGVDTTTTGATGRNR